MTLNTISNYNYIETKMALQRRKGLLGATTHLASDGCHRHLFTLGAVNMPWPSSKTLEWRQIRLRHLVKGCKVNARKALLSAKNWFGVFERGSHVC